MMALWLSFSLIGLELEREICHSEFSDIKNLKLLKLILAHKPIGYHFTKRLGQFKRVTFCRNSSQY